MRYAAMVRPAPTHLPAPTPLLTSSPSSSGVCPPLLLIPRYRCTLTSLSPACILSIRPPCWHHSPAARLDTCRCLQRLSSHAQPVYPFRAQARIRLTTFPHCRTAEHAAPTHGEVARKTPRKAQAPQGRTTGRACARERTGSNYNNKPPCEMHILHPPGRLTRQRRWGRG